MQLACGRDQNKHLHWVLTGVCAGMWRSSPALGEHSDEVLREHGFTESELNALREAGVVLTDEDSPPGVR